MSLQLIEHSDNNRGGGRGDATTRPTLGTGDATRDGTGSGMSQISGSALEKQRSSPSRHRLWTTVPPPRCGRSDTSAHGWDAVLAVASGLLSWAGHRHRNMTQTRECVCLRSILQEAVVECFQFSKWAAPPGQDWPLRSQSEWGPYHPLAEFPPHKSSTENEYINKRRSQGRKEGGQLGGQTRAWTLLSVSKSND